MRMKEQIWNDVPLRKVQIKICSISFDALRCLTIRTDLNKSILVIPFRDLVQEWFQRLPLFCDNQRQWKTLKLKWVWITGRGPSYCYAVLLLCPGKCYECVDYISQLILTVILNTTRDIILFILILYFSSINNGTERLE